MDRRYGQARAFDGTRASRGRSARGEALVRQYLGRARRENSSAQAYGGSTGGAKSIDPAAATEILRNRSVDLGEAREIFREEGSGALGGRASMWDAKRLPREGEDLY